jgi:cytochrome c peroxidase
MDIESKLRKYLIEKYGEPMSTAIRGYKQFEMKKSKCDMCHDYIQHRESFRYVPHTDLVDYEELWICKVCAKREHGNKNKYKWKDLYKTLKEEAS